MSKTYQCRNCCLPVSLCHPPPASLTNTSHIFTLVSLFDTGTLPPRPCRCSWLLFSSLQRDQLVFSVPPQAAAPTLQSLNRPQFAKSPTACSSRVYTKLWPRPPRFHSPQLSQFLSLPLGPKLRFCKAGCLQSYWSLRLPSQVHGFFALSAGSSTYARRRLPFGWSWSPAVAQLTLARILQPVCQLGEVKFLQYVDDVLLACPDPNLFGTCGLS